jgi:hypothetical protein
MAFVESDTSHNEDRAVSCRPLDDMMFPAGVLPLPGRAGQAGQAGQAT